MCLPLASRLSSGWGVPRASIPYPPDRLIVGEVRQSEALDLLIALNSGVPGMATVHANSAREAVTKLCTLPLLAGENVSHAFVVPTVASAVDLVIHLAKDGSGHRRVREIVALPGRTEGDVVEVSTLYRDEPGGAAHAGRRLPAARGAVRVGRIRPGRPADRHAASQPRTRRCLMGLLLGLLLGLGLFLVVTSGELRTKRSSSAATGWRRRTARLLAESGVRGVSPVQLVLLSGGLALFVAVIVLVLSSTVTLALAFGGFAATIPRSLLVRRRQARIRERRELWPEVVDHLASAVRAGLSLPEGVTGLATRGPVPLRPSFERFAEDYRAYGAFGPCLDRLADELADPAADRIVEALRLAREVGGTDLGRLLRTLSSFLRDDLRTRAELEARQGWTVSAARLALAAPWVVLLLFATRTNTVRAYDSPTGVLVLLIGGIGSVVAYLVMQPIGRLPQEPRVLRSAAEVQA